MTATATLDRTPTTGREKYLSFETLPEGFDPAVPGIGDGTPVVLAVDTDRHLTYTWYDQSPRTQDWHSRERGFLVSRLSVTYQTPAMAAAGKSGFEVAYLNLTHTTPELVASLFANPFRWADENTSASFGYRYRDEVTPQQEWASAYSDLRYEMTPPSAKDKRCWGAYSASDAPTDPAVLAAELAAAAKVYATRMRGFTRWLATPSVDFSHVDSTFEADRSPHAEHPGSLRGTGIGRRMYLLAAQHIAQRGKVLRASGLQSDEAQAMWQRLVADPTVPTRRTQNTYYRPAEQRTKTYWCIDYTRSTTVAA